MSSEFSATEKQFLETLRQQPELQTRFESILELTRNADGPVQTAAAVEAQLIEALRQLGHASMNPWAAQAEQRVSTELQPLEASVWSRKKKTLPWWCAFGLVTVRDRGWRSQAQSYLRPLPGRLGVTPRGKSRRLERVLPDFGCEHSFGRATASVLEHYGFELGASAVRTATLKHAQRARVLLQAESAQPFRALPAVPGGSTSVFRFKRIFERRCGKRCVFKRALWLSRFLPGPCGAVWRARVLAQRAAAGIGVLARQG